VHRPHGIQLLEPTIRIATQFLNSIPVIQLSLSLHLSQCDALQPRFLFENPQRIARFNALNLPRITAEHHPPAPLAGGEPEKLSHLPPGNHSGFVKNQHLLVGRLLRTSILQEMFHCHGIAEPDFLQLLDGAHGWGDRENFAPRFQQAAPQFLQRRRLAGACCPRDRNNLVT
jgi:hypothetical protein